MHASSSFIGQVKEYMNNAYFTASNRLSSRISSINSCMRKLNSNELYVNFRLHYKKKLNIRSISEFVTFTRTYNRYIVRLHDSDYTTKRNEQHELQRFQQIP